MRLKWLWDTCSFGLRSAGASFECFPQGVGGASGPLQWPHIIAVPHIIMRMAEAPQHVYDVWVTLTHISYLSSGPRSLILIMTMLTQISVWAPRRERALFAFGFHFNCILTPFNRLFVHRGSGSGIYQHKSGPSR